MANISGTLELPTDRPAAEPALPTRFMSRWAPWLLLLNLFGYPLIGLIATIADIDSVFASIPLRAVTLTVSLYVIVCTARRARWWRRNAWLAAFWIVYLLRLIYDSTVVQLPGAAEALGVFVGISLVPSVASGSAGMLALGPNRGARFLAFCGGFICALTVIIYLFDLGAARTIDADNTGGRLAFEAVNPITLGHVGASTLIALVSLSRGKMSATDGLFVLAIAVLATWTLLLAGSRGPIVALACSVAFFALATGRIGWVLAFGVGLGSALIYTDSVILERFSTATTDLSGLERLIIQGNAIVQFLASPLYGSAYVELESMEYPHNLFIETAMALGIGGLLILLVLLARAMRLAWRGIGMGQTLVPLLFIQYFVGAQFSGSLWGGAPLWLTLALLGSLPPSGRRAVAQRP